jgi:hypothetical protein
MADLSEGTSSDRIHHFPKGGFINATLSFEDWAASVDATILSTLTLPINFAGPPACYAPPSTISNAALIVRCCKWLLQRDPTGSIKRKKHLHDARSEFGAAMTTRLFAEAYKLAYGRRRGRPFKTT